MLLLIECLDDIISCILYFYQNKWRGTNYFLTFGGGEEPHMTASNSDPLTRRKIVSTFKRTFYTSIKL